MSRCPDERTQKVKSFSKCQSKRPAAFTDVFDNLLLSEWLSQVISFFSLYYNTYPSTLIYSSLSHDSVPTGSRIRVE